MRSGVRRDAPCRTQAQEKRIRSHEVSVGWIAVRIHISIDASTNDLSVVHVRRVRAESLGNHAHVGRVARMLGNRHKRCAAFAVKEARRPSISARW